MTAAELSKEEAKADICRAIAHRAVKIQGQLKKHTTRPMRASNVLEGKDFEIPTTIRSEDLDWERSRPVKPWLVSRGMFDPAGYWELEWIELSRDDVTHVLCTEQPGESVRRAPTNATSPSRPELERNAIAPGPRSSDPQSPSAAGSPRRRGPRPKKLEQAKTAMRNDIQQGRRPVAELKNMLEKNLQEAYGVSRDTARKARRAVLSEFGED